ncbi:MAG: type VI secretion system tip protein TssI/VgrG [Paracoccaceae bacterium]
MNSEAANNRLARLKGPLPENEMQLVRAEIVEELSGIVSGKIEFVSDKTKTDMVKIIGQSLTLETEFQYIKEKDVHERKWSLMCVSVHHMGKAQGLQLYVAQVRSWLWDLTQKVDCRIFQNLSVPDIIRQLVQESGHSNGLDLDLNETYNKRKYCVQYNETTYDFIYRLMAEEGIYFATEDASEYGKVFLRDSSSAYKKIEDNNPVTFFEMGGEQVPGRCAFELIEKQNLVPNAFVYDDYDQTIPQTDLTAKKTVSPGKHVTNDLEQYRYPTRSLDKKEGERFTKVRMEQTQLKHHMYQGQSTMLPFVAGRKFKISEHPLKRHNVEYVLTRVTHRIEVQSERHYLPEDPKNKKKPEFDITDGGSVGYFNSFDALPSDICFRTPYSVPWPTIAGIQTAVVTGPSGKELFISEDGEIKVQFHWDREGKKDDQTTALIRVAMPWSGDGYGMVNWPRIGQEVVIQFENGNPDRPLCTGMLYNGQKQVKGGLPGEASQTSLRSRSTEGGSDNTYNELTFEDKMAGEFVRLQSERDYMETIKNNATITIGLEHQDDGDLTQTVHRHKTETLNTGDYTFKVAEGSQDIFTKKNITQKTEGDETGTVEGKVTKTITKEFATTIKDGDVKQTLDKGSEINKVNLGDYTLKAGAGSITLQAAQKITLKVGASKIEIGPASIKIKSAMVEVEGVANTTVKSATTKIEGSAMLMQTGAVIKIN